MASITWVLFHELGHSAQEHGITRDKHCPTDDDASDSNDTANSSRAQTQEVNTKNKKLTYQESLIHHVTELAADYEATCNVMFEIIRHSTDSEAKDTKPNWQIVFDNCYFMIIGIACTFYRFNNGVLPQSELIPTGSHPNAFFRMEMTVRQICRQLRCLAELHKYDIADRNILVLAKQAADLAAFYWYFVQSDRNIDVTDLIVRGLTERPEFKEYTKEIISTRDKLTPEIFEARHFGSILGFLHFDKEHRDYIFDSEPT